MQQNKIDFRGAYTAMITPRTVTPTSLIETPNMELWRQLLNFQFYYNMDGVVVLGSTGEPNSIGELAAKREMLKIATDVAHEKDKRVILGASSEDEEIVKATYHMGQKYKVDGMLTMPLLGVKPGLDGLMNFYGALSDFGLPIIVYNNAGRSGKNITVAEMTELAKIPNVVAIKEASGDLYQIMGMINLSKKITDKNFRVLSGDDKLTLEIMKMGGHGTIAVVGNADPKNVKELVDWGTEYNIGDMRMPNVCLSEAEERDDMLAWLYAASAVAGNPGSIRHILNYMGIPIGPNSRGLGAISGPDAAKIEAIMNGSRMHILKDQWDAARAA